MNLDTWEKLREALRNACAAQRGLRAQIARDLNQSPAMISQWLAGQEPRYTIGCQLRAWLENHLTNPK